MNNQSEYDRGYIAGLTAAMKIAEAQEDYYEDKCDTWPEMQPNAVEGCKAVYWEIETAIEKHKTRQKRVRCA